MRTRRRATINDLRVAIDCMPRATRIAMLEGIRSNVIIAGAYADKNGICYDDYASALEQLQRAGESCEICAHDTAQSSA